MQLSYRINSYSCGYCSKFQDSILRTEDYRVCSGGLHVTALSNPCEYFTKQPKFFCLLEGKEVDRIQCEWQRNLAHFSCVECYNFANDPPPVRKRKKVLERPRRAKTDSRYVCLERPDVTCTKEMCEMNKKLNVEDCPECGIFDPPKIERPRRPRR